MTEVSIIYFALISIPIFLIAGLSDWKTGKLDVRSFFFLIGISYGSFFANNQPLILALAVSLSMVVLQVVLLRAKLPMIGSGDFPVFHAYNLIVMLFAPHIYVFIAFFLAPMIFFGLWVWFFKNRSFVPSIAIGLVLFFVIMLTMLSS